MSIVVLSEKGQITIPQEVRQQLHLSKGDPLLVETLPDGSMVIKPAAVFPIEIYTEQRLKEFKKEDTLTAQEKKRAQKFA